VFRDELVIIGYYRFDLKYLGIENIYDIVTVLIPNLPIIK